MEELQNKLSRYASTTPTQWRGEAMKRQKNREWLRYSQRIAMLMLDKMEESGITQKNVAERIGCSQQYISKILKGSENLSIETIYKIETALGIRIFESLY